MGYGVILLVDHQPQRRKPLEGDLRRHGYEVLTAYSAPSAVDIIARTANLTVVVTELEDHSPLAKTISRQVGELIQRRDGILLAVTDELPRALPGTLSLEYCEVHGIPVYLRSNWETQVLPAITAHLARMAG